MTPTGSNELNMLLKAKVVKIKVELDIKGSGLFGQVDDITKFLKDKRVKLKVELDTAGLHNEVNKLNTFLATSKKNVKIGVELKYNAKDINKQINQIADTIKNSKTGLSDLKIGVSIDVKGTASKIKAQLAEINKVIQEFNTNYRKQIETMNSQTQKIGSGGGRNSSASGAMADATMYAKTLKDAEQYMKSQFGKGLFSSTELKDATGQLNGFIATLTNANGVVQKIKYEWNKDANAFTPINQQTVTNTEKNVANAMKSLRELDVEIAKLGTNQAKFWQQYGSLQAQGANGTLTQQAVADLRTRIKEEQTLQSQIKVENDLLRQQKQLLAEIKREQKNAKSSSYKGELSNLRNSVATVNLDDTMARNTLKDMKASLESMKKSYQDNIAKEKDLARATEKRKDILTEISNLQKTSFLSNNSGSASARYVEETKQLAKNIKTMEDYNAVQKRMNATRRELSSIKLDNQMEAQMSRLKNVMSEFATVTGKSLATIDKRFDQVSHAVKGNLDLINNEIQRYTRLTRDFKADQSLLQRQSSLVDFGSKQANKTENQKIKAMVDAKDNQALKEYIANLNGANVAMMKLTTDSKGVSRITAQFESTKKTAKQVVYEIDNVDKKLRQLSTAEVFNANRNLGVFEQLKIAMARVPVWMVAMTAFHGSINTVRQMTDEILKLDKAMTELARVADSGIDIEHMFTGALEISKQLGNNIHDVMGSVNELARTFGQFNERQLLAITNTATLMSNVSDLNAKEATESLIGTMNAFNITAEDSIRIVDAMNEVDNNYAISTKQLATGLAKSASTAKTFGVTMEENVGHITAIGAVTMESGNIIGNSLKTIYSRITTMEASKDVLEGVGIALTDMNGDSRDVADIIDDLGNKWFTLSKSQQQNIAVTVAGRYQLSRFLALMNNYKMAQDSISTAYNSQGSAMRENARYMQSFEARINALKNSFTELSVSVGNAFLESGLSVGIDLLTNMGEIAVSVIDKIGILPVLLGTIGLALLKFGTFSKVIGSMIAGMTRMQVAYRTATVSINGATVATTRLGAVSRTAWASMTAGARTAGTAVKAFGTSAVVAIGGIKGAIASTGILAGFLVIGYAIEKLIGWLDENRRKAEELEQTNKKMIDSYRATGDGMQSMISEYETLYDKKQRNIDLTDEESNRLTELTNQFAEQLPTVVDYYDANGNAILKSTDAIKEQIKAVEDLSREQAKLMDMQLSENLQKEADSYEEIAKKIEKQKKTIEKYKNNEAHSYDEYGFVVYDQSANAKKAQEATIELMQLEQERRTVMSNITKTIQEQTVAYLEANSLMVGFGDNQRKLIENFVTYNDELLITAERNGTLAETSEELVTMTKKVAEVFTDAYDIMSQDLNTEELQELRTQLEAVSASVPEDFLVIDSDRPVESLNEITNGMKEIINVATHVQEGSEDFEYLSDRLEKAGLSSSQASEMLGRLGAQYSNASIRAEAMKQSVDGTTSSIEDLTQATIEAVDPISKLFGYETGDISAVKSHIETMELLYQKYGEGAEQNMAFMDSQQALVEFFNTTPENILENIHTYNLLADAIGKVKVATDEQGGSYLDLSEATSGLNATQRKLLDEWLNTGGATSIFTGELLEVDSQLGKTTETYDKAKTEMAEPFKPNIDLTPLNNLMNNNGLSNILNYNKDLRGLLSQNATALNQSLADVNSSTKNMTNMNTNISSVKKEAQGLKEEVKTTSTETKTSFDSMKSAVSSNTDSMISKHNAQRSTLQSLASQASTTESVIRNMNTNGKKSIDDLLAYRNRLNTALPSVSLPTNNFTKQSIGESFGSGMVAQSISTFSATAEGVASSMASGGEGTSGIIKPSVSAFEALHGTSGSSTYSYSGSSSSKASTASKKSTTSAVKKSTTTKTAKAVEKTAEELAELYVIDLLERKRQKYEASLGSIEAKISGLSKNTHKYRVAMLEAQDVERQVLALNQQDLATTIKRNAEIEKRLSILSNTSKHTKEQREEYNKLQQEYDSNLSKITQLTREIDQTIVDLRKKTEEIFIDFIEDIVGTMDEALEAISKRVDDIDFEMEVLELTDPDNQIAMVELMAEKVRDLTKQQKQYNDYQKDLEERIRYATSKYGAQSDAVKTLVSQMEDYREKWEDVTLEILKTEKEIRDMRGTIADDLIDSFKQQFEYVQEQAENTADIEIESARRAHDAKMKYYDAEAERIRKLYDERIKLLDDAYNQETYEEELSEKNKELAELRQKQVTYSGDTSLEGRKKSAEINDEILKKEKELNDFIRKNKLDTLKDQLGEERDMLLDKLDQEKEAETEAHESYISNLEAERDAISEHYASVTDDEKKWAKIREELMRGNFKVVKELLGEMGIDLEQLADGTFDTLSENFGTYSEEVRNFVLEINRMINEINAMTGTAYGKTTNIDTNQGVSISEPVNQYSVNELIRKAYDNEALLTPTEDKNQLYNMIQESGITEYRMNEIWRKAQAGIDLDIPSPEQMKFYNMFLEIIRANKLKKFDTGGYTGDSVPSSGGLAILHKKELVLNENQTSHILDAVKLIDRVKDMIPRVARSSMADKMSTASEFTNNNNYAININIERINGDKEGGQTVLKEIIKGMKKLGK